MRRALRQLAQAVDLEEQAARCGSCRGLLTRAEQCPARTKTAKNQRPTKKTAQRMTPKEKAVRNQERPALRPSAGGGISGVTANAAVFHSGPSETFTSTTHAVSIL